MKRFLFKFSYCSSIFLNLFVFFFHLLVHIHFDVKRPFSLVQFPSCLRFCVVLHSKHQNKTKIICFFPHNKSAERSLNGSPARCVHKTRDKHIRSITNFCVVFFYIQYTEPYNRIAIAIDSFKSMGLCRRFYICKCLAL